MNRLAIELIRTNRANPCKKLAPVAGLRVQQIAHRSLKHKNLIVKR